jgi:hypothetical protein
MGARGNVVGLGTMIQAGRSRVRFPMRSLDFQLAESFQPRCGPGVDQTLLGAKGRQLRKADNLTAMHISEL